MDCIPCNQTVITFSDGHSVFAEPPVQIGGSDGRVFDDGAAWQAQTSGTTQNLNGVWGSDFLGDSNLIDVYIRYLRGKIDDPFEEKLIQTVRGVGYALKE